MPRPSCRRWSPSAAWWARSGRRSPPTSGLPPGGPGGGRHAGPALGRRRRRAPSASYEAHLAVRTRRGSAARSPARRPTRSARSPPCPGSPPGALPGGRQPRHRRTGPRVAARHSASAGPPRLRRADRHGRAGRGRAAAACSSRPGSPASGRRSPTAGPGAGSTTSPSGPPGPSWSGPYWRAWPSTAAGSPRRWSGSSAGACRSGRIGGGATSALWCRIHADVLDRTVEQVADPVYANLRGRRCWPAWRSATWHPTRCGRACRWPDVSAPIRRTRAVYDGRFAEFPRLYRAQRGLFHRLNAGGR